jgi:uncharacterized RDD family membrane protein YckC
MNWYYVEAGQQAGPVDDAQLDDLRRIGRILDDTLVWREGMENWEAYSKVRTTAPPVATFPAVNDPAVVGTTREAVCVECGKIYNMDDMIRHGGSYVCAGCKPVFMQKLAEGAKTNPGALNYAGFWIRFGAHVLDVLILMAVNIFINMIGGLSAGQAFGVRPTGAIALQLILMAINLAIGVSYEVIMIGKFGATLGKMACKIHVVTADGGQVSYLRALGRYFSKILSSLICFIGFIMAGFDEQKRALHDHICNTRVVLK